MSEDIIEAVSTFDEKLQGAQSDWDELVTLMHSNPQRYAQLVNELDKRNRNRKDSISVDTYKAYSEYLYKRAEESGEFAQKTAESWRNGWNFTCLDIVPKLKTRGFPSTRRIAIEFLKKETSGETFNYDWTMEPEQNRESIQKWMKWMEINCTHKEEDGVY
jgi:hypothetical protein